MTIGSLQLLFRNNLEKLKAELIAYKDEKNIWRTERNIANTAGNLCLHLVGNLNTYIGAQLGKTGYIRNRDLEFSLKHIPREELLEKIKATMGVVETTLNSLHETDLGEEYPVLVFTEKTSTGYLLMHLAVHLGYHLGQINYHRRLLDI